MSTVGHADSDASVDPYEVVRDLGRRLSNWGRWGDDDEVGTLNLIDAAATAHGAACVRSGESFALGLEFGASGPQTADLPGRFNPQHYMTAIGTGYGESPGFHFSDDVIVMPLQCATQWDSLAHVHYDGQLYNGWPADESMNTFGTMRNGIDKQAARAYTTRGVLLDVTRHRGTPRVAPSSPISVGELQEIAAAANLDVQPGDIVLIRTGHINAFLEDDDRTTYNWAAPGIGLDSMPWFHELDVAAVCSDTTMVEVAPSEDPRLVSPVHLVALRDMGMPFGEMFNLEALADASAADGVADFMLCAQPLAIVGGIGSPVNPVAIR